MISGSSCRFGLTSFGDYGQTDSGTRENTAQVLASLLDEAIMAENTGADFFYVGEHHHEDYTISAPEVVLSNIAAKCARIQIGSSVTVLPLDDPIRVFERFSTLAALSNNRAEITVGKGASHKDYRLFGKPRNLDTELFTLALNQLIKIRDHNSSTFFPQIKIGTGGSIETIGLAIEKDLPLVMTVLSPLFSHYQKFANFYSLICQEQHKEHIPLLGAYAIGYIAPIDSQAYQEFYPHYLRMYNAIAQENGGSNLSQQEFTKRIGAKGSLMVGSPNTVAAKIANLIRDLRIGEFQLRYSIPGLTKTQRLRSIELYTTKVIPQVKQNLAEKIL